MVRDTSKYPRFKAAQEALIKRGAVSGLRTFTRVYFRTCAATSLAEGRTTRSGRRGALLQLGWFRSARVDCPICGREGSSAWLEHGTRRRLCCGEGLGATDRVAQGSFVSRVGRPGSHATCPSPTEAPAMAGPLILPKVAGGQRRLCSHRFPLGVQSRPFRAGGTRSVLWNRVQQRRHRRLTFRVLISLASNWPISFAPKEM